MCAGDDRDCPQFELHHQKLLEELDAERRSFLKSAVLCHWRGSSTDDRRRVPRLASCRPDDSGAAGQAEPSLSAGDRRNRPLGLFQ